MLTCGSCAAAGFVADSQHFLDPEILHEDARCTCLCDGREFEVLVGAALYEDSRDVRWWYVGGRCVRCDVLGIYVDWKDDGSPWEASLRPSTAGAGAQRSDCQ